MLKYLRRGNNLPREVEVFNRSVGEEFPKFFDLKLVVSQVLGINRGLVWLMQLFNLPHNADHNAGLDAQMTLELYRFLVAILNLNLLWSYYNQLWYSG